MNVGSSNDAAFSVVVAILADNSGRVAAEVENAEV